MQQQRARKRVTDVLIYRNGRRNNSTAKRQYLIWRSAQIPPIPVRCDNTECRFHTELLIWNCRTLPLVLEHINGVNTDNRPKNLRLLCPNCDSQNSSTRGGANARRVLKYDGGFALVGAAGTRQYVLPAEPIHFAMSFTTANMSIGHSNAMKPRDVR